MTNTEAVTDAITELIRTTGLDLERQTKLLDRLAIKTGANFTEVACWVSEEIRYQAEERKASLLVAHIRNQRLAPAESVTRFEFDLANRPDLELNGVLWNKSWTTETDLLITRVIVKITEYADADEEPYYEARGFVRQLTKAGKIDKRVNPYWKHLPDSMVGELVAYARSLA